MSPWDYIQWDRLFSIDLSRLKCFFGWGGGGIFFFVEGTYIVDMQVSGRLHQLELHPLPGQPSSRGS